MNSSNELPATAVTAAEKALALIDQLTMLQIAGTQVSQSPSILSNTARSTPLTLVASKGTKVFFL